jgi:molybdenum cofactor cytidylyltransferase
MLPADIAVAVLAAGRSTRFGSDKLMAPLNGLPLGLHIGHTLGELDFGWRFAICQVGAGISAQYATVGFAVIENADPEAGQAHSLHLAINAAQATAAKALLVVLADMPFITRGHITALVAKGVLAASTDGRASMPPALFPRDLWPDLLRTQGDAGARSLLHGARLVPASACELRDIDVAADLPRPQQ